MTEYHKYLKHWTSERGITSFLGSDKPAFQRDWKDEKSAHIRFGEEMGREDINRAGEPFKKPKPKPKPKPTTDQIKKNKLQQKIHALPTELRNIIKGYTVGDFTSEQREELTDLYENISRIYEIVRTAEYNVNGDSETPIYKPSGTAGRTPAVKSLFKEVADGMFDILEEIDRVLNFQEKDRDRHRYEIDGFELQDYGLTSRYDGDGYLFTNKVATTQLKADKKEIPKFQKELNRILKRAEVKKGKTKK